MTEDRKGPKQVIGKTGNIRKLIDRLPGEGEKVNNNNPDLRHPRRLGIKKCINTARCFTLPGCPLLLHTCIMHVMHKLYLNAEQCTINTCSARH
jgi:hypothetical protein